MGNYSNMVGEWDEPMLVLINGKEYPTQLYSGVQRFIPDPLVEKLIDLAIGNHGSYNKPGKSYYDAIPSQLKLGTHENPLVNYFVEENMYRYYGLNELTVDLYRLDDLPFSLVDYIDFETLHGWSVSGFESSISQKLENLGLGSYVLEDDTIVDEDEIAQLEENDVDFWWSGRGVFELTNPLWENFE